MTRTQTIQVVIVLACMLVMFACGYFTGLTRCEHSATLVQTGGRGGGPGQDGEDGGIYIAPGRK